MLRILEFVLASVLVICLFACESKKESKYISVENPELAADFQRFIEERRTLIQQTLERHGIHPTTDFTDSGKNDEDWLKYRVTFQKHKDTGELVLLQWVLIQGTTKIMNVDVPTGIMLMFDRRGNKWCLLLKEGYIYQPVGGGEDKKADLSPELTVAIKEIFPCHFDIARNSQ